MLFSKAHAAFGCGEEVVYEGGGGVLLNLPSPLMAFFLNLYVIDIHHILTFQTSGDTWPAAFHCYFD